MEKKQLDFQDIYAVVRLIPVGRVTSYGAIARYLGSSRGARLVGWAMNSAHGLPDVPAHRVVNSKGLLTGKHHFGDPQAMQLLLEAEGIQVQEDQVVGFRERFWDPCRELAL